MSDDLRCYYGDGERYVVKRHEADCAGNCRGCQPCDRGHCYLCGKTHADNVCPTCLAAVRDNIAKIVDRYFDLRDQALYGGHDGKLEAARPIPGGEAMVMLGPMSNGLSLPDYDEWITVDDEHPLHVLATWVDAWREWWEDPTGLRATVSRETAYLNEHLHRMARVEIRDGFASPDFAEMAADLASMVARLEAILRDQQGGYPAASCKDCGGRIKRKVAERFARAYCLGHGHLAVCPIPRHHGCADTGGALDVFECACGAEYDLDEYRTMVARDYLDHATALPAELMERRTGVKASTVRVWATRGKVRRLGKDANGLQLYSVEDVERCGDLFASVDV